ASPFAELATRTEAAVEEHLIVEGPLGRQWAFAVDASGGSELYHDANDLPVALAPLWGFCASDDAIWRTTMRFALGSANPGWVPGRHGGLGSRHTPGTWTLGDIQRWVSAALGGDLEGEEAALERLIEVADLHDGMLPEAYDPEGGGTAVRHWFAWPGAAFAVLYVEHAGTR
ncbi:MAG TPA: glycoside hydrolase family 125 protein, partial [Candidatus Limnocylindrales bacterium]|nr:glycoside hydrolase family 125 protein [Candidatus Limnocylindrales bacterium]